MSRPSGGVPRWRTLLLAPPLQLALLALAVWGAYGHTLDAPFYLDDYSSILENDLIYRWQGVGALWQFAPLRVLAYLSLALNYHLGHFDPAGYHLFNILVHALAAGAVFGLVRAALATPRLAGTVPPAETAGLPFLVALLFALHPLQSSAVTYIVQRLASMAALFYIGSMAAFVRARLARAGAPRLAWWALCVLLGVLALLTKENTATLPLALALLECVLFRHGVWGRLRVAAAGLGGMVVVWCAVAAVFGRNPLSAETVQSLTSDASRISRGAYLATQLPVLWVYIRLFFWPVGQHLDYADEHLDGFAHGEVWLALACHALVLGLALAAARRRPFLALGLLFYYLAHAMESSIFPLQDMMFEHRAYLPDLGLCLFGSWILLAEAPRWLGSAGRAWALAAAVVLVLGVLTWQRNQLWRDPTAFWRSNTHLAPTRARAWGSLARQLIEADRPAEAVAALQRSMELQRAKGGDDAVNPLDFVNLAVALHAMGRSDSALAVIDRNLERPLKPSIRARVHLNRGNILFTQGRLAEAEAEFRAALALDPGSIPCRANLASTLARSGRLAEAESLFEQVLAIDPGDRAIRENLLQARAGRWLQAADSLLRARRPREAAMAYREALRALEQVQQLDPTSAAARENVRRVRAAVEELERGRAVR